MPVNGGALKFQRNRLIAALDSPSLLADIRAGDAEAKQRREDLQERLRIVEQQIADFEAETAA